MRIGRRPLSWDCFRRGRWSKRPSTKAGRHQNGPIDQEAVAFRQVRKAFGLALPRGHQKAKPKAASVDMSCTRHCGQVTNPPALAPKPTTGPPLTGRLQLSELRVASRTMTLWPATRLGINSDQPRRRAAGRRRWPRPRRSYWSSRRIGGLCFATRRRPTALTQLPYPRVKVPFWAAWLGHPASYITKMSNRTVLISGLGIAGPTLAFWLKAGGSNRPWSSVRLDYEPEDMSSTSGDLATISRSVWGWRRISNASVIMPKRCASWMTE